MASRWREHDGNIWDRVLARIETKVNRHSFFTWFKPTAFVADDGPSLRVRVPNAHVPGLADQALLRRSSHEALAKSTGPASVVSLRDRGRRSAERPRCCRPPSPSDRATSDREPRLERPPGT